MVVITYSIIRQCLCMYIVCMLQPHNVSNFARSVFAQGQYGLRHLKEYTLLATEAEVTIGVQIKDIVYWK